MDLSSRAQVPVRARLREFGRRQWHRVVSDPHVLLHPPVRPEKMSVQSIPTVKEISPPVRARVKAQASVCLRRLLRRAVEVPPVLHRRRARLEKMSVQSIPTVKEISPPVRVRVKAPISVPSRRLLRRAVEVPPVLLHLPVSLARVVVLWMLTALAHSRPAALHVRPGMREFGWRLLRKAVEVLPVRLDQRVRPERMSVQLIPTVQDTSNRARVPASLQVTAYGSKVSLRVGKAERVTK
jgi:hypothetical protein